MDRARPVRPGSAPTDLELLISATQDVLAEFGGVGEESEPKTITALREALAKVVEPA